MRTVAAIFFPRVNARMLPTHRTLVVIMLHDYVRPRMVHACRKARRAFFSQEHMLKAAMSVAGVAEAYSTFSLVHLAAGTTEGDQATLAAWFAAREGAILVNNDFDALLLSSFASPKAAATAPPGAFIRIRLTSAVCSPCYVSYANASADINIQRNRKTRVDAEKRLLYRAPVLAEARAANERAVAVLVRLGVFPYPTILNSSLIENAHAGGDAPRRGGRQRRPRPPRGHLETSARPTKSDERRPPPGSWNNVRHFFVRHSTV